MLCIPCSMLIDTHCHLNSRAFNDDWRDVINRAFDNNTWMINVGTDEEMSQKAIEIAEKYKEGVYATVGFHPESLSEKMNLDSFEKLAKNPKVVAIGEIGLDYYRANDENTKKLQKELLRKQIEIAKKVNKPVVFHVRDAGDDLLEEVKPLLPFKAVVHCFSSSWKRAQKYLDMGLLISFTGIITYSDQLDKAVKNIPLDKIMIETDAPYLAPIPHRGKRNEPAYVKHIAQKIADIKGISFEEVEGQTTKTAKEFFSI